MNRKLFNLKNIAMVAVFSLIAFVGFNSFKNVNIKTAQQPALYWYTVDASNKIVALQNPTTRYTKSQVLPSGTIPLTTCNDTATDLCLVGFANMQTIGHPAGSPDSNHRIFKN